MDLNRSNPRAWAFCFWVFLSPLLFGVTSLVLSAPVYILSALELTPKSGPLWMWVELVLVVLLLVYILLVMVLSAFFVWWVWKRVRQLPSFSDSSSSPRDAA